MKVLLSWLRAFAPFEGDPVALGETMSDLGMAVEALDRVGDGLAGLVVGRVLETRPIPGANRIHQVVVDAGGPDPVEVGCGAFNMAPGDLVPLAPAGSTLPDGTPIGRRKMAGVTSDGMLCSARELGLGDDHGGIWLLGDGPAPGTELVDALGLAADDVRYELEINPNRPDAMSVAGVARDLAARLRLPFSIPAPGPVPVADSAPEVGVEILDPEGCGRFAARVLSGLRVGASPAPIAARLALLGMRPINNVVDASNLVMLELGQPNHAYDLARVAGPGFRIRRARAGETLVTLDGVQRTLEPSDLLICDALDGPLGLAGVMGGASSEIDATTTDVVVEMAWFRPVTIAATARRSKLRSEASARFEKGCDPEVIDVAMARLAEILAPAGAAMAATGTVADGALPERPAVRVRPARVNALLGTDLTAAEMADLLDPIGFRAEPGVGDELAVTVPSWRHDSATEIDVVEEIARHHGYGAIGRSLPASARAGALSERQRLRRRLRSTLAGAGLCEAMPMPFLAPDALVRAGLPDDGIEIANPLVADESILRTSLRPGLLAAVAHNARHRTSDVGLFEIGHVVNRPTDVDAELPDEREHLGVAWSGRDAHAAVTLWRVLAPVLGLADLAVVNGAQPGLHPTRSGTLVDQDGAVVGRLGEIDPEVIDRFGIGERVAWLEVDLDQAWARRRPEPSLRPFSLFPSTDVDLAFEVDEAVPAAEVAAAITAAAGELLWSSSLFDVYRGPGVAEGCRSLAFTLRFQAPDRTLTDEEVGAIRSRVIDAVTSALPAALRG